MRFAPAIHACERLPENGGTVQQAICYREEAVRQDQQLNAVWNRVIYRLSPADRASLRRRERRWIRDRDAECRQEAAAYINSTAAYILNVCRASETIRRTIWLEQSR